MPIPKTIEEIDEIKKTSNRLKPLENSFLPLDNLQQQELDLLPYELQEGTMSTIVIKL